MSARTLSPLFMEELRMELAATRKCLERFPFDKFDWKPHEKSMNFGYLALLVADIPRWIPLILEVGEIDFATYEHKEIKSTEALLAQFDANVAAAERALGASDNHAYEGNFYLKKNGKEITHSSKKENVMQSINHMVHHRGQLTVYLRLNDIAVPSIYGNSADEQPFKVQ